MINLFIYIGCFLFCWLVASLVWKATRKHRQDTEEYVTPKVLVENPFAPKEEPKVEMPKPKRKAFRKRIYKKKNNE
jgi:hypothetical protein